MRINHGIDRDMIPRLGIPKDFISDAINKIEQRMYAQEQQPRQKRAAIPVTYADMHGCVVCPRCATNMAVRYPR